MTLQEQIALGESRVLEFKKELPADSLKWIKTITAFANGAGGRLLIGVDNKRNICGLPKGTDIFELKDKITDTISQMCSPQIMFDISAESIDERQLLSVQVFPGNATPYYIKSQGKENGTYIRLGATTRNADWAALCELDNRGRNIFYDAMPYARLDVDKSDIDYLCRDFSERANRKITRKDLENMNLLLGKGRQTATNAYAILLGKHEHTSRIQCARFRGNERIDFLDKKDYEGPLCEQIDGAYKFVLNHINMAIEISGIVHKERYELPPKAIRELIINAVIHRNYQQHSSVQVAVYDDRLEISSPGSLYGTLTLEEALSGRSSIRNRTLSSVLEKIGVLEGWGSGFKRIFSQCREYGIPEPEFMEIGDLFRVNFYRPTEKIGGNSKKSAINVGDKQILSAAKQEIGDKNGKSAIKQDSGDKITEKHKADIIKYLKGHPESGTKEISANVGLKISRTRDYLSILAKEGKITATGANRNRKYSAK